MSIHATRILDTSEETTCQCCGAPMRVGDLLVQRGGRMFCSIDCERADRTGTDAEQDLMKRTLAAPDRFEQP